MTKHILLTIDVEDWFQVENLKSVVPFSTWDERELRVERNTHRLLDLFDAIKLSPTSPKDATNSIHPKATFFILGWLIRRMPQLVREIHARGHEVASHGFNHHLCTDQKHDELRKDLTESKSALEDTISAPVSGYRAPSFSINSNVLKIIEDSGYQYDSSYNSFGLHARYGKVDFSDNTKSGIAYNISDSFYELPVSNLEIGNKIIPWSGGGYFRLTPFFIFKQGIKKLLRNTSAYLFYMHPWEIDPDQPRVNDIPRNYRFRHYVNLHKTHRRLSALINDFKQCQFVTLHQYLTNLNVSHGQ